MAGNNPERLRSEAAFANLCVAASVQASSGKVIRHRLNPGGNRDANRALYVVALNRLRRGPQTRQYVARRTSEGKSKKEAMLRVAAVMDAPFPLIQAGASAVIVVAPRAPNRAADASSTHWSARASPCS